MSLQPVIRPAAGHDLQALLSITEASPSAPQWSVEEYRRILLFASRDGILTRTILVAELAGSIVGFAVAMALHVDSEADAELESIAVLPFWRGKGVGERLLSAVRAWATAQGCNLLRLEVRDSNSGARHLYRKQGFEETAVRPRYYSHPQEDAVCMEFRLHGRPYAPEER